MENTKFKIISIGSSTNHRDAIVESARLQDFDLVFYQDIQNFMDHLAQAANQIVLVFIEHNPPSYDAFAIRGAMMENHKEIPTIIKMQGFVRFEDMDQIIALKIKRVISEYGLDELGETIKKYNRREDLEIEDEIREAYILECHELLEEIESSILELEAHPSDIDSLNKLFRTVHTIKGSSGIVRWKEFEMYIHAFEELLTEVNSGRHVIDHSLAAVLLKGFDRMVELIESLSAERRLNFDQEQWISELTIQHIPSRLEAQTDKRTQQENGAKSTKVQGSRTIKVPIDSLSKLSFFVAQMLESQKKCHALVRSTDKANFDQQIIEIDTIICEIEEIEQDMLEKLEEVRCVSLKSVFQPYPRVVRDLGRSLAKQVEISFEGEDIRVDNTIASVLSNSLIHLVRNCIDHGIESVDQRLANHKKATGTIHIEGQKKGDDVTIIVTDDGQGIDLKRVHDLAIKRNLASAESLHNMPPDELIKIIFAPGFSTAEAVSSISGRGVGMDMVKSTVESVGGVIRVETLPGLGSKFILEFHGKNSVIYF